jgi:hypothetical protein
MPRGLTRNNANDRKRFEDTTSPAGVDTSDMALADLLKRLQGTADPCEIRRLSDQIERIIFHKQFSSA